MMPVSSQKDCILLQNDLNTLSQWCNTWNLFLNEDKCSVIRFTTSHSPVSFDYYFNGKKVSQKSTAKDLGLIVSAHFQWRPHYQQIMSKAYKTLGLLSRVFSASVATQAKLTLYTSLVCSKMLYCSVVWRPLLLVDIKCLELVYYQGFRFRLQTTSRNTTSTSFDDGI